MEEHPGFEKRPFQKVYLQESKEDIVTLRLNAEEREILNTLKRVCRCGMDSTVIKKAVEHLHNVIHGTSNKAFFEWLSEARRIRDSPD